MKPAFLNIAALAVLLAGGCASSQKTAPAHFDFSRVRRISIEPFDGPGAAAMTDEMIRALVGTGIEVSDGRHSGDVILKGTVTDYKAGNALMVFLGNTTLLTAAGQTVEVDNAVVSPGGVQMTPEGTSLGTRTAQVVTLVGTAGLNVVLIDPSSKNRIWAGSASYEAFDLKDAQRAVASTLTQALGQILPQMKKSLS